MNGEDSTNTTPPGTNEFNFIAQYVMEKISKEDPSVRLVMEQHMKSCFGTIAKALGFQ